MDTQQSKDQSIQATSLTDDLVHSNASPVDSSNQTDTFDTVPVDKTQQEMEEGQISIPQTFRGVSFPWTPEEIEAWRRERSARFPRMSAKQNTSNNKASSECKQQGIIKTKAKNHNKNHPIKTQANGSPDSSTSNSSPAPIDTPCPRKSLINQLIEQQNNKDTKNLMQIFLFAYSKYHCNT